MGTTRYYDLGFFDFGDQLNSPLSISKEIHRFVTIDKQLYGLYNVFGNGVIDGWVVEDKEYSTSTGISISINPGIGIISFMAAETNIPSSLNFLPVNSIIDIYVTLNSTTSRTRSVKFLYILSSIVVPSSFIRLARVTTGTNNILSIDNTVKNMVGFEAIIQDEINQHRHRGTPPKIDLTEETKNQLPGARIEGIDASAIISGKFDIDRIPIIDHNDLEHNGLLNHAALDSFVQVLSQNNIELLGEVASVNLLKTIIFLKYIYPDADEHLVNEVTVIPGVSDDEMIDFNASTAHINLEDQCISGFPARVGKFTSVYWRDQTSFYNAYLKDQVLVSGGTVSLERTGSNIDVIENFEVNSCNENIDFAKEIILRNDHAQVISQCGDSDKIQGKYSGKFTADTDLRATFTKNLKVIDSGTGQSIGRDWSSDYDELVIWAKTINDSHEAVYFYAINGDYGPDEEIDSKDMMGPFVLIAEDYVTSNADTSMNNFEEIVINLAELRDSFNKRMNNVTQFVIYTDEISNDFSFLVDNIYVRRTNLVSPSGTIRFRYSSGANITFHSIFYDANTPAGTSVAVRVKVSNSNNLLPRTAYSSSLSSGQIFAIDGTDAEIEVILTSSSETVTPVLSSVELRLLVDSNFTGFNINTRGEWNEGSYRNISLENTSVVENADLVLSSPINVDGYYFGKSDSVSENNFNNIAILGFSGSHMPISPGQAFNWDNSPYRKFDRLSSVVRKLDKSFLIADTQNNRVLEVGSNGQIIKGFGTAHIVDTDFYPLSAVYNPETHVVSLVFTKGAVVQDITKLALYIGSSRVSLGDEETILQNGKSSNRVLEILLYEDNYVKLANVTSNLFASFEEGAFTEAINIENSNTNKLHGLYGIECFVGDFTYVNYIKHPIFFDILDDNSWIVSNSSIFYDSVVSANEEDIIVTDLVEFNPITQQIIFSTDYIKFSDFTLGSVFEYETGRFLAAGIRAGTTLEGITGEDLLSPYDEDSPAPEKVKFRAAALDALGGYRGSIAIIDRVNNKYNVFYTSPDGLYPSDINMYSDGRLLVSESSFGDASGRLIILDAFGNIIMSFGSGTFNIISDAKILNNDHILVSV